VLGWDCSARAWDAAVTSALARTDYVVQERVRAGAQRLPVLKGGVVSHLPHHFDINPYIWADGSARGCLARISESERLNLSTGDGSLTPVFVVDGEEPYQATGSR
jgi:hypothetical protein